MFGAASKLRDWRTPRIPVAVGGGSLEVLRGLQEYLLLFIEWLQGMKILNLFQRKSGHEESNSAGVAYPRTALSMKFSQARLITTLPRCDTRCSLERFVVSVESEWHGKARACIRVRGLHCVERLKLACLLVFISSS